MQKKITVLYEDGHLRVLNKPPGLLVIPSPKKEKITLTSLVNSSIDPAKGKWHPCHRLDRDTTGTILYAKGKKMQQMMMQEFKKNAVQKKYIAFIRGKLKRSKGEISKAIKDFHQKKYARKSAPKQALTRYRVLTSANVFSVVEVRPLTGRTNQIRIHFSGLGHPLLGERLYAFGKDFEVNFRRLALHARELIWHHPVLKRMIKVTAPLPRDMEDFLGAHSIRFDLKF